MFADDIINSRALREELGIGVCIEGLQGSMKQEQKMSDKKFINIDDVKISAEVMRARLAEDAGKEGLDGVCARLQYNIAPVFIVLAAEEINRGTDIDDILGAACCAMADIVINTCGLTGATPGDNPQFNYHAELMIANLAENLRRVVNDDRIRFKMEATAVKIQTVKGGAQ